MSIKKKLYFAEILKLLISVKCYSQLHQPVSMYCLNIILAYFVIISLSVLTWIGPGKAVIFVVGIGHNFDSCSLNRWLDGENFRD